MGMWPDLVFWFFLAFGEVIMRRAGQPLHGEGQRPGTLRRPHRQALAAGLSQRATRTWREVSEQGYFGACQNVVRITRYLKEQEVLGEPLPNCSPGISAGQAASIPVKRLENHSEAESNTTNRLKKLHWVTERCSSLFEEFAGMLRDKEHRSFVRCFRPPSVSCGFLMYTPGSCHKR